MSLHSSLTPPLHHCPLSSFMGIVSFPRFCLFLLRLPSNPRQSMGTAAGSPIPRVRKSAAESYLAIALVSGRIEEFQPTLLRFTTCKSFGARYLGLRSSTSTSISASPPSSPFFASCRISYWIRFRSSLLNMPYRSQRMLIAAISPYAHTPRILSRPGYMIAHIWHDRSIAPLLLRRSGFD